MKHTPGGVTRQPTTAELTAYIISALSMFYRAKSARDVEWWDAVIGDRLARMEKRKSAEAAGAKDGEF